MITLEVLIEDIGLHIQRSQVVCYDDEYTSMTCFILNELFNIDLQRKRDQCHKTCIFFSLSAFSLFSGLILISGVS